MKNRGIGTRMLRDESFVGLGMLIGLIIVILWAVPSMGASFQSVPNQAFGLHWGMSLEEAQKVRSLQEGPKIGDKFVMYMDTEFSPEDMTGMLGVTYLFMDGRLIGAFLKFHCINDVVAYIETFSVLYGIPGIMDADSGIAEWEQSGNIMRIAVFSELLIMGNKILMNKADEVLADQAAKQPKLEEKTPEPDTNVVPFDNSSRKNEI